MNIYLNNLNKVSNFSYAKNQKVIFSSVFIFVFYKYYFI